MASRRHHLCLALIAALLGHAGPARAAQDEPPSAAERETARTLMQTGDAKLAAGDLAGALEAYRSADDIMGVPTTTLAVARVLALQGQLVSAVDALARVRRRPRAADEPEVYRNARAEAAKLDAELARRIPTVTVRVEGPSEATPVTVAVDGVPLSGSAARQPRRVDPGRRVVEVRAPGYRTATEEVTLAEQQHETLDVTLEADPHAPAPHAPAPSPVPSSQATTQVASTADGDDGLPLTVATWAGFGLGGAGLLLGTVTGAVVLARTSDLESRCGGTSCPAAEQDAHDTTVTLANVSNAGFVLGALGAAVGTTALILDLTSHGDADQAIVPILSPGFVGLHGRF